MYSGLKPNNPKKLNSLTRFTANLTLRKSETFGWIRTSRYTINLKKSYSQTLTLSEVVKKKFIFSFNFEPN